MSEENYLEVKLPCGAVCLIDKKDSWIKKVFPYWASCRAHVYVQRNFRTKYGLVKERYYLHRLIIGKPIKGFDIDHINRNALDNRRKNLRLATRSENCINKAKAKGCTSKYRGVTWRGYVNKKNPWSAYISKDNKRTELGYFKTEKDAALAYNNAARKIHKEFAFQNEIEN